MSCEYCKDDKLPCLSCGSKRIVIRKPLMKFSEKMEEKLKKNDHKGGWTDCEQEYLIFRLDQELAELREAIYCDSHEKIIDEAVDVANFAMMIADNIRL